MPDQEPERGTLRLPTVSLIVALVSFPIVIVVSAAGFLKSPGDESLGALVSCLVVAVCSLALGHGAVWAARRNGRAVSGRAILGLALAYTALVVCVAGYAFPRVRLGLATWRTPPNYEMTLELQSTPEKPVTAEMIDQFKTRLSLRMSRQLVPHEFLPAAAPRAVLRLRVEEGADMSRPFQSPLLTFNLVHERSDDLLASTSADSKPADGWKVVANGSTRLVVKNEPLLIDDVHDARVVPDSAGKFGVLVLFGTEGVERLRLAMRDFPGRRVAVLLDDQPHAAPQLAGVPPQGNELLIGADLELSEATELALVLRLGMLPVPVRVIEGRFLK